MIFYYFYLKNYRRTVENLMKTKIETHDFKSEIDYFAFVKLYMHKT